jgi:hypothetical protein
MPLKREQTYYRVIGAVALALVGEDSGGRYKDGFPMV